MKTGLVLEGGAMRGIYTAGVLDVLMREEITADGIIGVSAGAIHGSGYKSCQPGRSVRYYLKYCQDKRFMSFHSLITTGDIVNKQFCYHDIPERLDPFDNDTFEKTPMEYYVTCSNLETGRAEYIRCDTLRGDDMEYLRASASMPLVTRIVEIGGKKMLDGGVCDSIPIKAFRDMGYDRVVVVLTRAKGYRKSPENVKLPKLMYRKYPKFIDAILNRHENYNETLRYIEELEAQDKIIVIRPSEDLGIGRMEKDRDKISQQYELGKKDTELKLEAIREFFSK